LALGKSLEVKKEECGGGDSFFSLVVNRGLKEKNSRHRLPFFPLPHQGQKEIVSAEPGAASLFPPFAFLETESHGALEKLSVRIWPPFPPFPSPRLSFRDGMKFITWRVPVEVSFSFLPCLSLEARKEKGIK